MRRAIPWMLLLLLAAALLPPQVPAHPATGSALDEIETGERTATAPPATATPPGMPAGRGGFELLPAPDGTAMLVTIDRCAVCNKPSEAPTTTYLARDGVWTELGVDVDARWVNGEPHLTPRSPELGYSGNVWLTFERRDEQGAAYVPSPFAFDVQVGGTDRVEWRVYDLGSDPGDPPRRIMPAFNEQAGYSHWRLWWPDVPAEPVRLELWAEVRPAVAGDADANGIPFIAEEDTRWAVLWRETVRRDPAETTAQSVSLRSIFMEGTETGWGVDTAGRIVRTADGGHTWRDVTPPGHARCDGRLAPRQAEYFAGDLAVVALTCDWTSSDGRWSDWPRRISLFTTTDAGRSWREATIDTGYRFAMPASVQGADGHLWLLARPLWPEANSDGALWRSVDGGTTWTRIADTNGALPAARGVTFATAERGWALGPIAAGNARGPSGPGRAAGSPLWRTDNGGRTWTEQSLPAAADGGHANDPPQFLDGQTGFVPIQLPETGPNDHARQLLLATVDGGETWSVRGERRSYKQPRFLTPEHGYAWDADFDELAWTADGGRTWQALPLPDGVLWWDWLQFIDVQHGFIATGTLLTTTDGGRTWHELSPQLVR